MSCPANIVTTASNVSRPRSLCVPQIFHCLGASDLSSATAPGFYEADGAQVAKHVCRAQHAVPLRRQRPHAHKAERGAPEKSNAKSTGRSACATCRNRRGILRRLISRARLTVDPGALSIPALRARTKARDAPLRMTDEAFEFWIRSAPVVAFAKCGDMCDVVAAVPGIQLQIIFESHGAAFGMAKFALPVGRCERV